ncbi:reverse transcriptase domain-containing protein [Christiangramia sp. OXR-203]|uniref:reverse transcriptase domain-containing protein n=1 Tax=Christiangramia sp. OXR-203 TaxID=3100176 RepID=UPI002AC9E865|nr:reverse transcriptase domain-containing protein [Christiangramia sp. OXR-203]WPY97616.1 reverse transcriptase domain-containing protein [Christiangramia sp. OXR-203]
MAKTLLEKISSQENLLNAWGKLNKTNKSSHGLDKISIEEFGDNIDDKILSISNKLQSGTYQFSQNRAVLIPKDNGKFRPLQVPNISDRLVLKAIAIELEDQFKSVIKKSDGVSFAYQKKLGVKDAIDKIKELYDKGNHFVLEADLVNFFGTVDKDELLNKQIFPKLKDDSLNNLITSALNQKIGGLDKIKTKDRKYFKGLNNGIPQGNPLSPLLSNIYLSPFDIFLKSNNYNLVRYADDFVILCESEELCRKAYEDSKKMLNKLNLEIHPLEEKGKTNIININKEPFDFLSITFNGSKFYPSEKNVSRFKSKIRDICNGTVDYNVLTLLKKISNVYEGWISAFYYTEIERYSEEIDYYINRQLFLVLSKYDWKFTPKTKGKLPREYKQKGESADCLSKKQRSKSGIPLCEELLKIKRSSKNAT